MSMLLVAITICPVSASKTDADTGSKAKSNEYSYMKLSADYTEVATSENVTMYADLNNGLIAIKNNVNGYIWYSTPTNIDSDAFSKGEVKRESQSQLIIGYVNADDEIATSRMDYLDSSSAKSVDVTEIENGINVVYNFEIDLSTSAETEDAEEQSDSVVEDGSEEAVDTELETSDESLSADDIVEETKIVKASFPISFKLENGYLGVSVDTNAVKQTEDIIIVDYNVLPYFGAGSWTDKGYMFVPDGSGALINFSSATGGPSDYSQMVYGEEKSLKEEQLNSSFTETINMPVFGMVHNNDNGFVAVIDNGAAVASINASPANSNKGHNTINASFNDKLISTTVMFAKTSSTQIIHRITKKSEDLRELSLRYYFLENDDADYVGMAKTYREYLLESNLLSKKDTTPKLNVDLYGAIDVKANFMGVTYSKLKSLTSYSQAVEIAETLKEKGIDDIDFRYHGWGNNGITNANPITSAKTVKLLGGDKEFKNLINYTNENGINLYPESDLLTFTKGNNNLASKNTFGQTFYEYQYLRSVYVFDLKGFQKKALNPSKIAENTNKFVKSYSKLGVDGVSLSTLTNKVYSHLKQDSQVYRSNIPAIASKSLKTVTENKINVAGETANEYSFNYLSKIYKSPIFSSGYNCFDSEVPFYQIVLHGYVPMTGDTMVQSMDSDTTYLKCVESGIELLWMGIYEDSVAVSDTIYDDLYGSTYTLWADDAAARYAKYQPLLKKVHDSAIVGHTEITNTVTETEYENGVKVYVNFSDTDYTVNGIKIPARDFVYREG